MSALDELYQSVILDHNRNPRNWGRLPAPARQADGYNPLCGDQVAVYVLVDGDTVREVTFEGQGCAISKASASLMTTAVKGRPRAEVERLVGGFHDLVTGKGATEGARALPSSLRVFANVAQFPTRVKCASLAWHALRAALDDKPPAVVQLGS